MVTESVWVWLIGFAFVSLIVITLAIYGPLGIIAAIAKSPQIAADFGITAPAWLIRTCTAAILLAFGYLFLPKLTVFVVGLAVLILPVAITTLLLLGVLSGLVSRDGFGDAFWSISRHAVTLCAVFAILIVPFSYTKLQANRSAYDHPREARSG